MDADLTERLAVLDAEYAQVSQRYNAARAAILTEQRQREDVRREQEAAFFAAELEAWQQAAGFMNLEQYTAKYALHWREVQTGVENSILTGHRPPPRFFKGNVTPVGVLYFDDVPPTDEQRAIMRHETLFSKGDAALWLGISESQFDRRRKQAGLEPAEKKPTSGGFVMHLYRLSDIERSKRTANN